MKKFFKLAAAFAAIGFALAMTSCSNSSDSVPPYVPNFAPGAAVYKVNVSSGIEHGSVTANPTSGAAGTEITLTATADQNYVWSSYTVTGAGGAAVSVSPQGTFIMPASDVTVSATFVFGASATISTFPAVVLSFNQDATIAMTGPLTYSDISIINTALKASSHKIKLDLRGVTGLSYLQHNAFFNCGKLQSISFPEGLTRIDDNVFGDCYSLESVWLPASLDTIGPSSFSTGLNSVLSSINVAEGNAIYSSVDGVLFSDGKKTLETCPQGKTGVYTVPDGVTEIEAQAFIDCKSLTAINLPESLQQIRFGAFSGTLIKSMTIPASLDSIDSIWGSIFYGNAELVSLTFMDKENWYYTDNEAKFKQRADGTSLNLDDPAANADEFRSASGKYYYKDVPLSPVVAGFKQNVAALSQPSSLSISGQVKKTDLHAICEAIQGASCKIKLDMSGVTGLSSLPQKAFDSCNNLQEIILPEGLVSVGKEAFQNCNDLEIVSLPASLARIGDDAFVCIKLSSVNVAQGNAFYSSVDGVLFSKDKKTLFLCPKGKSGSYKIPSGVKTVADRAFDTCIHITGLTIPNSVEKIGEAAFLATQITSLVVPASVTSIGKRFLLNCHNLDSLSFETPSGWKYATTKDDWLRKTGGTAIDLSGASQNASDFKNAGAAHSGYYLYK